MKENICITSITKNSSVTLRNWKKKLFNMFSALSSFTIETVPKTIEIRRRSAACSDVTIKSVEYVNASANIAIK